MLINRLPMTQPNFLQFSGTISAQGAHYSKSLLIPPILPRASKTWPMMVQLPFGQGACYGSSLEEYRMIPRFSKPDRRISRNLSLWLDLIGKSQRGVCKTYDVCNHSTLFLFALLLVGNEYRFLIFFSFFFGGGACFIVIGTIMASYGYLLGGDC